MVSNDHENAYGEVDDNDDVPLLDGGGIQIAAVAMHVGGGGGGGGGGEDRELVEFNEHDHHADHDGMLEADPEVRLIVT